MIVRVSSRLCAVHLLSSATVSERYDLNRYRAEKLFYGRSEVKYMIEASLAVIDGNADRDTIAVAVQHILTLLFPFYIGCRPGSLAPSHEQYARRGQASIPPTSSRRFNSPVSHAVPKDWRCHSPEGRPTDHPVNLPPCSLQGLLSRTYSGIHPPSSDQGYNAAHGDRHRHTFTPVEKAHNAIFDIGMWLSLYLMLRGVLDYRVSCLPPLPQFAYSLLS